MPKTRENKEQTVAGLTEALSSMQAAVLTHYQGLTVREISQMRAAFREQGVTYEVLKNTLFKRAADKAGIKIGQPTGTLGLAIGQEDVVQVAKVVSKAAKDYEPLEIVGGIVEGEEVDVDVIKRLAALPSREELLGRFIGSISAPPRNLASALSATTRNLVYALRAVRESKA